MKRPDFDTFREIFLQCLSELTGLADPALAETKWAEIGGREVRQAVLESVRKKLREDYGLEFEVNHRLLAVEGPVESAVIQAFHELSTIHLMERINARIRAKLN